MKAVPYCSRTRVISRVLEDYMHTDVHETISDWMDKPIEELAGKKGHRHHRKRNHHRRRIGIPYGKDRGWSTCGKPEFREPTPICGGLPQRWRQSSGGHAFQVVEHSRLNVGFPSEENSAILGKSTHEQFSGGNHWKTKKQQIRLTSSNFIHSNGWTMNWQ